MHTIKNTQPIDMRGYGTLEPGTWLCGDQNAMELGLMAPRGSFSITFLGGAPIMSKTSVIIVRSGAWGDLLFLTPVIRKLREKYPKLKIGLSCFKQHWPLFESSKLFDELVEYPLSESKFKEYDSVLGLDNVMELETKRHATDAFASALGIESIEGYKPAYVLGDEENSWANGKFPRNHHPRLGIQMFASTANRNYPLNQWQQVCQKIMERGWEIYALGLAGNMGKIPDGAGFVNVAKHNLSFRESVAVLKTCDAFCGIDSVWLHMCHALDIPAVGLYGPFDWKTRTAHAPLTTALSGTGECSPCSWHSHLGQHFPPNKPCSQGKQCTVLADISVERIVSKVDSLKPNQK